MPKISHYDTHKYKQKTLPQGMRNLHRIPYSVMYLFRAGSPASVSAHTLFKTVNSCKEDSGMEQAKKRCWTTVQGLNPYSKKD